MVNYLWVVEYNPSPDKLKKAWAPIIIHPEWTKQGAILAAHDRAKETGIVSKCYRVKKYISI